MAMDGVFKPRLLMSVTPLRVVMLTTITSLHVLTILLMPLKLFGRHWVCQKVIGETWIHPGLMLKLPYLKYTMLKLLKFTQK